MNVLVAEDDPVSRRLLTSYLENWGHEVTVAEDGVAAWELFQPGEFPIVLSDWMMPNMDGVELVRRIRASERPGYVFVVLITSRHDKADVAEGIESGADEFLTKPVDRDELHVRLWEAERVIALHETLNHQSRVLQDVLTETEVLNQKGLTAAADQRATLDVLRQSLIALRADVLAAVPEPERERLDGRFEACLDCLLDTEDRLGEE